MQAAVNGNAGSTLGDCIRNTCRLSEEPSLNIQETPEEILLFE